MRAKDGVEALEMLRQGHVRKPFIALLDINMPRMNGIDMLSELRADPKLFDSVVFILTTSRDDQDKFEAYKKNVAGYIVKKQVGEAFLSIVEMLGNYWRIVELLSMNNTDKSMMPITLLIVDDDDIDREAIKRALRFTQRPLEIIEANTGRQGINQFQENKIDVLLIDYRLPDIDGFSVIRALKQSENVCTIIMVSQHEDEVVSAQAITVGAHDFLLKSEVNAERLNRAIHQAQHRHILENELRQKTKSLKSLAQTDYLTGLINRRSFEQILQESYVETHYSASTLAVLFIDLDHFKKINDSLGHSVGDKLLKKSSETV